jgi:hydroxyacylglutathione hydrolase
MKIETISTESLGNRGYLIHDGVFGVALDVQRDYDRWIEAAKTGVQITHVFETHMHNDYVTGGYQLARELDATYVVPAQSGISFRATELADSEIIEIGSLRITGYHTPGHTEHHMSYKIADSSDSAVFTGGGILYGTVGRTDLVSEDKTHQLTKAQYDSAQRLGSVLDDTTEIFPTHGFGSFCSSAKGSDATESTMATEKQSNVVFTKSRDEFVSQIVAGLGPHPRYYAHMGGLNQLGPAPVKQLHMHEYSSDVLASWLQQGDAWVIDVRSRRLFAANHPEGAVGIELGTSFATYAGWLIPWGNKLMLVGDSAQDVRQAYTELTRIGMEQFIKGATHQMVPYLTATTASSYLVKSFDDLKSLDERPFVLDVRLASDWNECRVKGATSIPLHELIERIDEVPDVVDVWVHCASGYRASIAASLLDRFGRHPILINDDFSKAVAAKITQ